ncbi:MAG: hypothetical protein ACOZQL_15260 [Myxococcota bacterium]
MQVHVFPPRPSLERQVRELRVIETDVDVERVLVPEPALLLGVRTAGAAFDEHGRVPDETLTGLRRTARRMRTVAGSRLVLVVFRELGARAFFDVPLHELAERTVSLDTLIPVTALRRVRAAVRSTSERHAQVAAPRWPRCRTSSSTSAGRTRWWIDACSARSHTSSSPSTCSPRASA